MLTRGRSDTLKSYSKSVLKSRVINVSHRPRFNPSHIITIQTCRLSSSSTASNMGSDKSMLLSFSEYNDAYGFISQINYSKAIPLLSRVRDVIRSAMGPSSPLSCFISINLTKCLLMNGNNLKAEHLLTEDISKVKGYDRGHIIMLQWLSQIMLSKGDINTALECADKSVNLLQSHDYGVDVDLFHASYGLQGLCHLLNGHDLSMAENMLQYSARWSQSNLSEIIALNNLGVMCWLKGENRQQWRLDQYLHPTQMTSTDEGSRLDSRDGYGTFTKEALEYWDEVLQLSSKAGSSSTIANSSLCGINTPSSSPRESMDVLQDRLSNVNFAVSYATVLANQAEAYESLGEYDKSADALASAVKSLDRHKDGPLTEPILGRLLGLIAYAQLHKKLAVTAEGYFRASLEKFSKSPYTQNDLRHSYEYAVMKGGYGLLLTRWDKREEHGRNYILESEKSIKDISNVTKSKNYLSQSFLYPEIVDVI